MNEPTPGANCTIGATAAGPLSIVIFRVLPASAPVLPRINKPWREAVLLVTFVSPVKLLLPVSVRLPGTVLALPVVPLLSASVRPPSSGATVPWSRFWETVMA